MAAQSRILAWKIPGTESCRVQSSALQLLSHVQVFATPWTEAIQASLSITNSQSLLKLTSIDSVMPSSHLILSRQLLLPLSIFPIIRVFSNDSVLIRWPKIGVSTTVLAFPMNIQDWFPLIWTGWIFWQSKGLSRIFSNTIVQKHQFCAQLYSPTLRSTHDQWKNYSLD